MYFMRRDGNHIWIGTSKVFFFVTINNVPVFHAGQDSAIVEKNVLSELWRNRRLMASNNESQEEKNCTEPGKKWRLLYGILGPTFT